MSEKLDNKDKISLKRLFYIINILLDGFYTIQYLQEELKKIFDKNFTYRDIANDISNLELLGFIFEKIPKNKLIGSKYKISKIPIKFPIKDEEIETIKILYDNNKDFFENISNFLNLDIDLKSNFKNSENLVYEKKFYSSSKKIFLKAKKDGKKVLFNYLASSNNEKKEYSGYIYDFQIDEKKVERFILYDEKSSNYFEFNLERLEKPEPILLINEKKNIDFIPKMAKFKLYHPVSKMYHLSDKYEDIIEENKDYSIIKTRYISEFRLVQKILKYGDKAEIIEPETAREKIKAILFNTLKNYE